jgi:D-alanyl-D-alanine carboxypeptidase (penicillin-binding protein 5/6)
VGAACGVCLRFFCHGVFLAMLMHHLSRVAYTLLVLLLLQSPLHAAAPLPEPPTIAARSFVLMDFNSGQMLADSNADQRIEPASITKLMTAYIVFTELAKGQLKLTDEIPVSEKAWRTDGSRMFINVGSKVKLEDLIRGMIIQSGNDATLALAEAVAGSEETFADLMNQYASKLGMSNSHFTNSYGWPDPNHYSTARDIGILGRAIIRDFPQYYTYYSEKEFVYNNIRQYNRNKLLGNEPGVDGIKTGYTETAGYCLVSSAERNGMRLISVVIGTESDKARTAAARSLLNYGYRFFETHKLYDAGKPVDRIRVWKGGEPEVQIGVQHTLYVTTPRGHRDNLSIQAQVQNMVMAPVALGQKLGQVRVSLGGQLLKEEPLVTMQGVARGSWWRRMLDDVRLRLKSD